MESMENLYISLCSGLERHEIALEQVEEFVRAPQVIPVPSPPAGVAGMMEYRGALIPLFFLSDSADCVADEAACTAVLRNPDGTFYGILAKEIS